MVQNLNRVQIRNLDSEVIVKLDRLSAQAKMSREEYLRNWITRHTQSSELTEQRFMYEELVERLTAALESSNEVFQTVAGELRDIKMELEGLRNERA